MTLDDVLCYMEDKDSFSVLVDLCVYPDKKFVLIPYYRNFTDRNCKIRGSLNFKILGSFQEDTKEDFYNKLALCFEECLKAYNHQPELECNVRTVITAKEFETEYKRNNCLGYHLINIRYHRRNPLWIKQNQESQKMLGKFLLTESFPYKKGNDWAGWCKFVIDKSKIKSHLYDDIITLINQNYNTVVYADSKLAKGETIYQ